MSGRLSALTNRINRELFRQVDASSLVVFRLLFGLTMAIEVFRYFDNGWIGPYFIAPEFMFKYYGFGWVEPLPGSGMYWVFVLMGVSAFGILAGAFYRVSTVLFFLTFTYIFLLDQAMYLNHFYLVILLAVLLMFVPAHRTWSVDAWVRPRLRKDTVPGWAIWIFRLQLEVVLLYAGIVKLNPDWLRLEPMGMWLARRADFPLVGQFFTEDWAVAVASYGVIALHLIGAPLLLFRRTRLVVIGVYFLFHLMNVVLFSIGIFPWLTMAATLLFLEPDWPRRVIGKFNEWQARGIGAPGSPESPRTGVIGSMHRQAGPAGQPSPMARKGVIGLMGVWLAIQIFFPLRHLLYPGYVSWTEEGHQFSWQMMLRNKTAETEFIARDPKTLAVNRVYLQKYLTPRQIDKMVKRPEMILQFAHHLVERAEEEEGIEGLEVWVRACVSLNGRKEAWLVDPLRNLAEVERSLRPADWILPLENPPERPPVATGRENLHCRLPTPRR